MLQNKRHDLMNHLQIVQGYLSMGKVDVVADKMNHIIAEYEQERLLMNTQATQFILWTLQFNSKHENIRLTYKIHTRNINLKSLDTKLIYAGNIVTNMIREQGEASDLYEVAMELCVQQDDAHIIFIIHGYFKDWRANKELLTAFTEVKEQKDGLRCMMRISLV